VGEEEESRRKERSYNNDGFVGRVATRVGPPRKITGATTRRAAALKWDSGPRGREPETAGYEHGG